MNVYHIAYAPKAKIVHLHFWGCNLSCRACLLLKEIYDCHIEEIRSSIFAEEKKTEGVPRKFLGLEEVMEILGKLEVASVIFMGGEPAIDPGLPQLAEALHKKFKSHNILLTNGFKIIDLGHIDEVVFSIKAVTDSLHRDYTGKSNKKALNNFVRLNQSGIRLRAESIFIPEYIDHLEIENIARFIGRVNRNIPYRIDAYIPVGDSPWRRPTTEEMEEAVTTAERYLANVSCLKGNEELRHEVVRIF
jgi:pyruvate formate lyase activating enzyme